MSVETRDLSAPIISRYQLPSPLRGHAGSSRGGLTTLGLATVLLGAFLSMTDFFIVNVALPTISQDLHPSSGMLQLVVAGYGTPYALLLVVGGRLGDAIGRRGMFTLGMAAFTIASLVCGVAPSIFWLVVARAAQGTAAALMVPQVLSTIQATTTGQARAQALGIFGATGAMAAVTGQVLGGLLVTLNISGLGWRPIFLVNVPIGLLGIALAARRMPDTRSAEPAAIDPLGTVLLAGAVGGLLVPLTEGRGLGWPLWSIVLVALAPCALLAFIAAEQRIERMGGVPLVPLSLLGMLSMRRGLLVALLFFVGFGGFMFVYPLALQGAAHLSALEAGGALVPMASGFLLTSLTSARLIARFGHRVIICGLVLGIVGISMLSVTLLDAWPAVNFFLLAPAMLVAGIGWGMVMSPLFGVVLSDVPTTRVGAGSGVLVTTQQVALALGVATLGSLYVVQQSTDNLGSLNALLTVLGVLIVLSAAAAVLSRKLPNVR